MRYLDSCASIGMHGPTDARVPWKTASLLDDMQHAGIHGALVWHWLAREYDPGYGNHVLMEETASHDRLLPCWVLVPHHAGEMAPGPEVVAEMQERGVRAAKMFPRRHGYRFDEEVCGPIFAALEAAAIPLLIDVGSGRGGSAGDVRRGGEALCPVSRPAGAASKGEVESDARCARAPRPAPEHLRRVLQLPDPLRARIPRRDGRRGSAAARDGVALQEPRRGPLVHRLLRAVGGGQGEGGRRQPRPPAEARHAAGAVSGARSGRDPRTRPSAASRSTTSPSSTRTRTCCTTGSWAAATSRCRGATRST